MSNIDRPLRSEVVELECKLGASDNEQLEVGTSGNAPVAQVDLVSNWMPLIRIIAKVIARDLLSPEGARDV